MDRVTKNRNDKWWQLFKTGKHISAAGEEFNADEKKLDMIINATKNHVYANDEIPICIGHKKEDSPKWGAFKKDSFKRAGEYLIGRYDYLVTEFAEYISRKMFDKVSIALYPDLAIKHIALLGVQAPSIKGLASIEMNETPGTGEISLEIEFPEFAEYEKESPAPGIAGIIRNIKNFLAGKFNPEEAEKVIPECSLAGLNMTGKNHEQENNSFTEVNNKNKEYNMPEKIEAQVPQEFAEKLTEYEKEITNLKSRLLESEIKEFCESPVMSKKITPALLPHVKQIYMDLLTGTPEAEFSEGESKTKKTAGLESFRKILSALPDAVQFSEYATKEKAGTAAEPGLAEFSEMTVNDEAMELHRKALKIQSEEKCSYVEAVRKASKQ
jgi:hypothetical protein